MANIENRILEKKIAEKKKEELRQKNIAVILRQERNLYKNLDIFRCTETPRGRRGFINRILMLRRKRSYFPIPNSVEVVKGGYFLILNS